MTKLAGKFGAYVAEPRGETIHKDKAILISPDVIGIWQNSKLIADQIAAHGYYTILVDTFNGDALQLNRPADFDFPAWLRKHGIETVESSIDAAVKHLKEEKGFKKIGAVGYCFGAKYVCRYLNGRGFDVGYVAHPVGTFAQPLLPAFLLSCHLCSCSC